MNFTKCKYQFINNNNNNIQRCFSKSQFELIKEKKKEKQAKKVCIITKTTVDSSKYKAFPPITKLNLLFGIKDFQEFNSIFSINLLLGMEEFIYFLIYKIFIYKENEIMYDFERIHFNSFLTK